MRFADLPADLDAFQQAILDRGWSDGLPVMPPTAERVEAMLAGADPELSIGEMAPSGHAATLEALAANAVMAGCRPAIFPVLQAIVTAVLAPRFNLLGVQTTTHPAGPFAIVSGSDHLGVNSGAGAFGPGFAGSATLARAVRLVLMNVGGAHPGVTDQATLGHPGKYAFLLGENVAESPWGAYVAPDDALVPAPHLAPTDAFTRVTLVAGEGPHNISDHHSDTAAEMMTSILGTIDQVGMNNWYHKLAPLVLVLCPEHAHLFAREGYRRADIAEWIYREAGLPVEKFSPGLFPQLATTRLDMEGQTPPPGSWVRAFYSPEQVIVVVAGGPGRHSMVVPTFGNSQAVQVAASGR